MAPDAPRQWHVHFTGLSIAVREGSQIIAWISGRAGSEWRKHQTVIDDAHLIAAAPDLFAALTEVAELLSQHAPTWWYLGGHDKRIQDTITQARGGHSRG